MILLIRHELTESKQNILSDSDFLFKQAMQDDHNTRLKKEENHYYWHQVSHDWPKEKIVLTTEEGERVQDNVDSIRALPVEEKVRLIRETSLLASHPINPDSLNTCFQKTLLERHISIQSGVRYVEVENNKTFYSEADSSFFTTAQPLTEYKTGIFNEIELQSYVKIPFLTLVEKAGILFFISVIIWLLLFSSFLIYIYIIVVRRKKIELQTTLHEEALEKEKPEEFMRLDMEKYYLYYNGQNIKLTQSLCQLMSLFLNSSDHFLTKEEISNELWGNLDDYTNRLSQTISRLRSALAPIPEIEIINERSTGFRLVIPVQADENAFTEDKKTSLSSRS